MPEVGFDPYPEDIAVPRLYPPTLGVGPPTGHVDSPLFTMLPAEVRLPSDDLLSRPWAKATRLAIHLQIKAPRENPTRMMWSSAW